MTKAEGWVDDWYVFALGDEWGWNEGNKYWGWENMIKIKIFDCNLI